jgi:hypothetical protein
LVLAHGATGKIEASTTRKPCIPLTVLNLGKMLAARTPAEIRAHREGLIACLGS